MPTHNGVEVWVEDSEHRRVAHQDVVINLVDDRTVTVKTEMSRGEHYTVHCLSPISVFCDVFVTTASRVRKRAARFYVLATSENASGSSADHVEGNFMERGIRTPKKQFQHGKLGSLEVEIRRIGEINKGEPQEEREADGPGGEDVPLEFSMMDDFDQSPWLTFSFDIRAKQLRTVLGPAAKRSRKPFLLPKSSMSITGDFETSGKGDHEYPHWKKRRMEHNAVVGSVGTDNNPTEANSDRLQQEYEKETVEEQRLVHRLQEQLRAKKARNMELRRLLGEGL